MCRLVDSIARSCSTSKVATSALGIDCLLGAGGAATAEAAGTPKLANIPAVITCSDVMAEQHPELVVAFMKGMIKVGCWSNENKRAAAAILDKQTFYKDVEDTYQGIKHIDMVPNLSPQKMAAIEIGKDFMVSHGYIKNDFDVHKWAAPEFLERAAKELINERWAKVTGDKLPEASAARLARGSPGCLAMPGSRSRPGASTRSIDQEEPFDECGNSLD